MIFILSKFMIHKHSNSTQSKQSKPSYQSKLSPMSSSRLMLPPILSKRKLPYYLLIEEQHLIDKQINYQLVLENKPTQYCTLNIANNIKEDTRPVLNNSELYKQTWQLISRVIKFAKLTDRSLMVLQGKYTKNLYVNFNNVKHIPLSICCESTIQVVIQSKKLSVICEYCEARLIEIILPQAVNNSEQISSLEAVRLSKMIESGDHRRANLLSKLRYKKNIDMNLSRSINLSNLSLVYTHK